jgi:sodium transport system permease protein
LIIGTVARKELRELFRDARSVTLSIGVPLVLFPLLFLVLDGTLELQRTEGSRVAAVIAVEENALSGTEAAAITARYTVVPGDPVAAVRAGDAAVGLDRTGAIVYNNRSEISAAAAVQLQTDLTRAIGGTAGVPSDANPARTAPRGATRKVRTVHGVDANGPEGTDSAATVGGASAAPGSRLIVPARRLSIASAAAIFVLLSALVSLLPAALEVGAGEKQRQSLEMLLGATGRRGELVLGKLLAVVVTGAIGVAAFLGGVGLAVRSVPGLLGDATNHPSVLALILSGEVSPGTLLSVLAAALTAVILIGAIELDISLVARSPREAQGLFLPLLLLVSAAGYAAVLTDAWHTPWWFGWLPLLNVAVTIKAAILEAPPTVPVVLAVLENLAIAGILGALGGRILHSEWVLRRS